MTSDESRKKSGVERSEDKAKQQLAQQVEAAIFNSGLDPEKAARAVQQIAANLPERHKRAAAVEAEQDAFKGLQRYEAGARVAQGNPNRMGFFTDKSFGRPGPKAEDKLAMRQLERGEQPRVVGQSLRKLVEPSPARPQQPTPEQPRRFDWAKAAENAPERTKPDIARSTDRDIER